MNDHLVVVTLNGGMMELASLISEYGFSGNVGGNKIYLFFSIAETCPIYSGIWAVLKLVPHRGDIFLLVECMPWRWFLMCPFCISSDSGKNCWHFWWWGGAIWGSFPCGCSWYQWLWWGNLLRRGDIWMIVQWRVVRRYCWWLPRSLGCLWWNLRCDWSVWWWRERSRANLGSWRR